MVIDVIGGILVRFTFLLQVKITYVVVDLKRMVMTGDVKWYGI